MQLFGNLSFVKKECTFDVFHNAEESQKNWMVISVSLF